MIHTQKGYNTGFKDGYGVDIHVGDKVVEGCNLRVSTVEIGTSPDLDDLEFDIKM